MVRRSTFGAMGLHGVLVATILCAIVSCGSTPPRNQDDLCEIFREKSSWYKKARRAARRWGTAIPVMMAFAHQESGFRSNAKPPRKKILWIIPGPRPASAFGFAQATDETWRAYRKSAGRRGADRNDFKDAMDFIGWYNDQSQRKNGIAKTDAYNLYLAYHEGQGGYRKRSYEQKQWLKDVARKVSSRSSTYARQLGTCEKELSKGFLRRLFS